MKIAIIGTGYVGLTTGVALAYVGHHVTAVDTDRAKIALLQDGKSPIHEVGIEALLTQAASRLAFSEALAEVIPLAEVVFIAVGTPSKATGEADLSYVEGVAREIASALVHGQTCTVVIKSTVPIGTNRRVIHLVERTLAARGVSATVYFASNPEFLREGVAVQDTLYPDRIVVGAEQQEAFAVLSRVYRPLVEQTFVPPSFLPRPEGYRLPNLVTMDLVSAEMTKYAANSFLALKISFINEIAGLCERVGADVTEVARGMGLDHRIGHRFLDAGIGWGGSCFPKDTAALLAVANEYGYTMPIIQAARAVNERQRQAVVDKLQSELKVLRGRSIAVLGLSFKPGTDDVRDSPAVDIVRILIERGAHVRVHDPIALSNAKDVLRDLDIDFSSTPYEAVRGADAVVLATAWDEYQLLDLARLAQTMRVPLLIDGRNQITPDLALEAGLRYVGIGR